MAKIKSGDEYSHSLPRSDGEQQTLFDLRRYEIEPVAEWYWENNYHEEFREQDREALSHLLPKSQNSTFMEQPNNLLPKNSPKLEEEIDRGGFREQFREQPSNLLPKLPSTPFPDSVTSGFREQFREQPHNLLPKSENPEFREQIERCPEDFREQPETGLLLSPGETIKIKGRFWKLTHSKHRTPIPTSSGWFDTKLINSKIYLYLRWREGKKQRSKCLGKIEPI